MLRTSAPLIGALEVTRKVAMEFEVIEQTGFRAIGSLAKIGVIGPKHYAVVIGRNSLDGRIYVAEQQVSGYHLTRIEEFQSRYICNGSLYLEKNYGSRSSIEVAMRALDEVRRGGNGSYNLLLNNCESFCNRATYGSSASAQVIRTLIAVLAFAFVTWHTLRVQSA